MGQLEDLFVKEEHRAQGLGKRLFGELGAIAKERNCGRVEWRVLKVSLVPPHHLFLSSSSLRRSVTHHHSYDVVLVARRRSGCLAQWLHRVVAYCRDILPPLPQSRTPFSTSFDLALQMTLHCVITNPPRLTCLSGTSRPSTSMWNASRPIICMSGTPCGSRATRASNGSWR